MVVSKERFLSDVIGVYDELERLAGKNKELLRKVRKLEANAPSETDCKLMKIGKERLLEQCFGFWCEVGVEEVDGGVKPALSLDEWAIQCMKVRPIPEGMSASTVLDICRDEVTKMYMAKFSDERAVHEGDGVE